MTSSPEPERLEDLGAAIAGDRRDAHLGHDLEQALFGRVDQLFTLLHDGGGAVLAPRRLKLDAVSCRCRAASRTAC